jgi:uncharacterized protein
MVPELTAANTPFWTGGADGQLLIQFCDTCNRWQHPPAETCSICAGPVAARPVSGRGTIFTFTVNEQMFNPEVAPPYNVAIVTLEEQGDLRVPTSIVGIADSEIQVDMAVKVAFEQHGDVCVPLFEPV